MPNAERNRYAIAVLEDPHARLLLVRRSPQRKLGAGLWGFPGGHIEGEETPRECVGRELVEELGGDIIVTVEQQLEPVADSFYGGTLQIHLFHCRWHGGSVRLNTEHTEFAWCAADRFRDFDVMPGIDEDIALLDLWPRAVLRADRLPPALRDGAS